MRFIRKNENFYVGRWDYKVVGDEIEEGVWGIWEKRVKKMRVDDGEYKGGNY